MAIRRFGALTSHGSHSVALLASAGAGAIAGVVDLFAACLINAAKPTYIMMVIAGGLLGPASFHAAGSKLLGFALQVAMGVLIALLFWAVRLSLPGRFGRPLIVLGGGVVTFLVMNFVVLPLSAWRRLPKLTLEHGALDLVAMVVFSAIVVYGADALATALARARR